MIPSVYALLSELPEVEAVSLLTLGGRVEFQASLLEVSLSDPSLDNDFSCRYRDCSEVKVKFLSGCLGVYVPDSNYGNLRVFVPESIQMGRPSVNMSVNRKTLVSVWMCFLMVSVLLW